MAIKQIDNNIIKLAQAGEISAFEKILSFYEKVVYNYIFRFVKNREDAEDTTQNVFIKLYKNLKKFNFQNKFSTWLFSIAKNTVNDFFRKKKRIAESLTFDCMDGKMVNFLSNFSSSRFDFTRNIKIDVDNAMSKIKPVYKKVITLFYHDGLAYVEISRSLKIPLNTVKTYIYRAKLDLQKELL